MSSTKRKATDDSNPLLTVSKKAKPNKANTSSNKRKLLNGEEQPGGLMIVRESEPPQRAPSPSSKPSAVPGSSRPPSKKFKATASATASDVERDVRDMVDESNAIRQKTKSRQQAATGSTSFQIPERSSGMTTPARKRGKTKDETQPLQTAETPQIQKNKQLRGELDSPSSDVGSSGGRRGHRRRSSLSGRGKRISGAFEESGVIVQPHKAIEPSSYHKHIDPDQPEQDRLRQLFIWCSSRASSSKVPVSLPRLSEEEAKALKEAQDDVIQRLAEKELLAFKSPGKARVTSQPQENEQNRLNRLREVRFTQEIESHEEEQAGWTRRQAMYDQWFKQEQGIIDRRKAELAGDLPPPTPSAKAKGKRRATEEAEGSTGTDEQDLPQLDLLSDRLRAGVSLAMSVLGVRGEHRLPGWKSRTERQEQLDTLVSDMEFKLDTLHNYLNSAKSTAGIAERTLDQRFGLLSAILTARANPFPTPPAAAPASNTGSVSELLSTYVPKAGLSQPDPQLLYRALAGVDSQRPPEKVSDAARWAAKEVRRAEEVGAAGGILSERKLTTPRKAPGTPRRAATPSRERNRN